MPAIRAVAIDVETTGLDPSEHRVVDIAAVGVCIVDPATGSQDAWQPLYSSLVDPERDIPVAIDVETTGLDPSEHRVVDIAAVGVCIVDPATGSQDAWQPLYSSLVDPERDIPAAASAVHHLTAKDVAGHGQRHPDRRPLQRAGLRPRGGPA